MRPGGDADYENSAGTETRQSLNSAALQHPANPPSPAPRLSTISNQAVNVGFRVHAGRYWVPRQRGNVRRTKGARGTRTILVLCSNRGKRRRNPGSCPTQGVTTSTPIRESNCELFGGRYCHNNSAKVLRTTEVNTSLNHDVEPN